jgi:hypothetical protein
VQALALHDELQLAGLERLADILEPRLGRPIAAVPKLNRAPAILPLGNRPLEIAVIQRMVLDLDG